jgi:hypothetical protein
VQPNGECQVAGLLCFIAAGNLFDTQHFLCGQRQVFHPRSDRIVYSIGDGRRGGHGGDLSDTFGAEWAISLGVSSSWI